MSPAIRPPSLECTKRVFYIQAWQLLKLLLWSVNIKGVFLHQLCELGKREDENQCPLLVIDTTQACCRPHQHLFAGSSSDSVCIHHSRQPHRKAGADNGAGGCSRHSCGRRENSRSAPNFTTTAATYTRPCLCLTSTGGKGLGANQRSQFVQTMQECQRGCGGSLSGPPWHWPV